MKPALVIQHGDSAPPGLLGDWLDERNIPFVVHRADGADPWPEVSDFSFVACLGSRHAPTDDHEPSVRTSMVHVARALDHDVPVLGLCFGGQLLASVLGGKVEPAPRPELGWRTLETDDPALVPPGPWLQWHFHRFTTPPEAQEIARNEVGSQAFRLGPHLGVQFHPESTVDIVSGWARKDVARLAEHGVTDWQALLDGRDRAAQAAQNARRLFDGFWNGARRGEETDGAP